MDRSMDRSVARDDDRPRPPVVGCFWRERGQGPQFHACSEASAMPVGMAGRWMKFFARGGAQAAEFAPVYAMEAQAGALSSTTL